MPISIEDNNFGVVNIKVVGIGGAGGNAVNHMIQNGMLGVEFVAMNTDAGALNLNKATQKIVLGMNLTKGFGAGSDPEVGKQAAEESREEIAAVLKGAGMVFVTAGMGGGTGTGAAPIIASIARDMGILTIGVVTKPFGFEGKRKREIAEMGIAELRKCVDSIIIIPNDRLSRVTEERITFLNAFEIADNVLKQAVQSISDVINVPLLVNPDFNDINAVLRNGGDAHIGVGRASGRDKAEIAANIAMNSPLLETSIDGATGVIMSFMAAPGIDLFDIEQAAHMIESKADRNAIIILGAGINESLNDELIVTVIAASGPNLDLNIPPEFTRQPTAPAQELPQQDPYDIPGGFMRQTGDKKPRADTDTNIDLNSLINLLNSRDNDFSDK